MKLAYVMLGEEEGRREDTKHHHYHQISLSLSLSLSSQEKMFNYPPGWNILPWGGRQWRDLTWLVLILQPSGPAVSVLSDGLRLVPSNRKWIIVISATPSCAGPVQSGLTWQPELGWPSLFVNTTSQAQDWLTESGSTFPINPFLELTVQ